MVSREKKIEEAVARMKSLDMLDATIDGIRKGNVWVSDLCGILYDIKLNSDGTNEYSELLEAIERVEKKLNGLVYHVIRDTMGMTCYLYVCDTEDEWEYDRDDLSHGQAIAYVCGYDDEIGSIGVKPSMGGLVRVW